MKVKIIKEIITNILLEAGFTVSEVILFGSRARGDFLEESDWDILILIRENLTLEERKNFGESYTILCIRIFLNLHST